MERQFRGQMMKAFWDILEADVKAGNLDHVQKLLDEIKDTLKALVPGRADIHRQIDEDITTPDWEVQIRLVDWAERFQSPSLDAVTREIKQQLPMEISRFLKFYYSHLQDIHREVHDTRARLSNGENIFEAPHVQSSGNGVPDSLKTGRRL